MQLILLSKDRGHLGHVRLTSGRVWLGLVAVTLLVAASAFYGGITAARAFGISNPQAAQVDTWREELAQQQSIVDATRRTLQQNIDALALRIGQMNAHVVRLDALGTRLTQMAGLKDGEFDFTTAPSLGGPEEPILDTEAMQINGVVGALDVLDEQLVDRGRQLTVLEDLLLNRKLRDEVRPEGRPVTAGYVSSQFGGRTDPFTVPSGFLFMMGDIRDNSYDSRFWGPVAMDLVKGRAMFIYYSTGGNSWWNYLLNTRFDRMFRPIR